MIARNQYLCDENILHNLNLTNFVILIVEGLQTQKLDLATIKTLFKSKNLHNFVLSNNYYQPY